MQARTHAHTVYWLLFYRTEEGGHCQEFSTTSQSVSRPPLPYLVAVTLAVTLVILYYRYAGYTTVVLATQLRRLLHCC